MRALRTRAFALAFPIGLALAPGSTLGPPPCRADGFAIVGARIHPIDEPVIERGTLVVEGGRITDLGALVDVDVSEVRELVDGSGLDLWPGMINLYSRIGLVEINAVRATKDDDEAGGVNPSVVAITAVNPDAEAIAVTRAEGVLLSVTSPVGGLVPGRLSVIALDGWTPAEMSRRDVAGLLVNWPEVPAERPEKPEEPPAWEKDMESLEELLAETRAYVAARRSAPGASEAGAGTRPPDVRWEALAPVVSGEVPIWVRATTVTEIQSALDWAEREHVRLVLVDGALHHAGDAWRLADRLAARGVPVILRPNRLPRRDHEGYDVPFRAAAILERSGVKLGFFTDGATGVRRLPQWAARAHAGGLGRAATERALTLSAAEILGIDADYGSLTPGKSATFILVEGDLLETRMRVRRAWLDGRELDLASRHTRLRDRYRGRPARGD